MNHGSEYSATAGVISLAVPQLLKFIAFGQIGAGLASIFSLLGHVALVGKRAVRTSANSPLFSEECTQFNEGDYT